MVEADAAKLLPALTELLEGPRTQTGDDQPKAILLVIDDFEQALEVVAQAPSPATVPAGAPPAGPDANRGSWQDEGSRGSCPTTAPLHRLKAEYFACIRALVVAFQHAATESHLLFTCRFEFTCPHDGRDLADADHLLDGPLRGMNEREAQKQADAKLRVPAVARVVARLPRERRKALRTQIARSILHARGNPGLQDLHFTLAVNDPAACDRRLRPPPGVYEGIPQGWHAAGGGQGPGVPREPRPARACRPDHARAARTPPRGHALRPARAGGDDADAGGGPWA